MKKALFFLLLFFGVATLFAQKDTDHWFAPMIDRAGSGTTQALYLSTDSVTPFPVSIYNNNAVIGTVTISKGNPGTYAVPTAIIMLAASQASQLFSANTRGLYLKADTPFYATLRIYSSAHGEIIASKGKAALGTTFYSANTPVLSNISITNFSTAVLASEDNTSVTVSGYDPTVQFTGVSPTPATLTFTLNKGQSYIIEGSGSTSGNVEKFIGAKITSTKPITVMNGNMNGQYINTGAGSDIIMDQSVPIERLGDEFAMVKGNGTTSGGLEGAMVIATENGTGIFLNNSTTPIATINEGDFYMIPGSNYINQGNEHYNLYIKTTHNAYVYQLLGGGTSLASNGYNYIPPLNCYLPRKIDEIAKVSEISPTSSPSITIKLNIITEAGASVTLNGSPIAATNGPYPITGSTNWVTYSVPGVSGNITVNSTKAVTAGINGGYSTAGYGGYFAGFSSVPAIVKSYGNCIPGIILQVDNVYETYQWFLNGNPITGATTNTYTPTLPGNYTITVGISGCNPVTTPVYKVFPCPKLTTVNLDICGSQTFTPQFTSSSQTIDLSSVVVTTPPAHGSVTINPTTGVLTYVPTAGYLGPDTFVYEFHGNVPTFFDSEIVTVNLNVVVLETHPDTLYACKYNGVGIFNLTTANVTTFANPSYKFYPTLADLNNNTNQIVNTTSYQSAGGTVYVKVTTPEGCVDKAIVTLAFYPSPIVNDATLVECFIEANPTTALFNLTAANVTSTSPVTKEYYLTLSDAQNGVNGIPNANAAAYISSNKVIYVKVFNSNGCYSISKITLQVTPPKFSTILVDKYICVENRTTLDAGPGFDAYSWSTGATTQSIAGVGVGEYWVLLTSNGCITKQIVKVYKSQDPVITNVELTNDTATLTVSGGTPPYQYSLDGVLWQSSHVFENLPRGQNTFYVKDFYNCEPVTLEITVPNLINAITPNGDGINDFIDYSALAYKKNLTFSVYDRYGKRVHVGDQKTNYRWDGKFSDKKINTGTYWYHLTWEENKEKTPQIKYTGWILVKNK